MYSVKGFRRFLGFLCACITVIILAALKAPGEAYLALGALATGFFGAAGIEKWQNKGEDK